VLEYSEISIIVLVPLFTWFRVAHVSSRQTKKQKLRDWKLDGYQKETSEIGQESRLFGSLIHDLEKN
jgi:hypothetical protein